MFDNLFVEMGPWAATLALLVVLLIPAIVASGQIAARSSVRR